MDPAKEVATIPSDINDIRKNTTETYIEETKEPAKSIVKEFCSVGKDLAKDNPFGLSIQIGFCLIGIILATSIIVGGVAAIHRAFGKIWKN